MSGDILAIASGKGGVGKTVTAVNLATSIRLQQRSVVLIDGDLAMPNLAEWFDIDPEPTLHDVLADKVNLQEATVEKAKGFVLLPAGHELEGFAEADPTQFAYVIDRLARQFDHVIIDTGGGLSFENSFPLQIADDIILVTSPNSPAISDTERTKQLSEILDGSIRGVIVTMADNTTDAPAIAQQLGVELFGTIPDDDAVDESIAASQPLEVCAPKSAAARAYRQLGAKLLTETEARTEEPVNRG